MATKVTMPENLWIPSGTIELRTAGQVSSLRPAIDGLDRIFYSGCRKMRTNGPSEIIRLMEPLLQRYHQPPSSPHFRFFAGLATLVRDYLVRLGVTLKIVNLTRSSLPPINEKELKKLKIVDRHVLDFVREHDRCLVRYGRHVRLAVLLAQMIRAWPRKKFLIATTRKREANALVQDLRQLGITVAHFNEKRCPPHARVIVGIYQRFGNGAATVEYRDIFIALNPTELFDGVDRDYATMLLGCLHRARAIGMLAESTPVAPRTQDFMTALFGPSVVALPRHGYRNREVEVLFSPIFAPSVPNSKYDHVIRRVAIVEHPIRNRRIVALARALEQGDRKTLRTMLPKIGSQLKRGRRNRICILVDNVDHGVTLGTELGWPAVAGVATEGVADAEAIALARNNKLPVVATTLGLGKVGEIDILIRADGGKGIPALPDRVVQEKYGERRLLLIIDFDDRHHPVLRKASRRRRRAYETAGLTVDGHMISALDRFLRTRPDVYGPDPELAGAATEERS
jgi:hypothetical protein